MKILMICGRTGKELTPKSGYDFKFKDYSPWVFKHVRDIFHVEPIEYLVIPQNSNYCFIFIRNH